MSWSAPRATPRAAQTRRGKAIFTFCVLAAQRQPEIRKPLVNDAAHVTGHGYNTGFVFPGNACHVQEDSPSGFTATAEIVPAIARRHMHRARS